MKVKLRDLVPNPFRDMANYPIDRKKIESLKQSIEQTGFWDNILTRKVGDKYQIAYGHHRLTVLNLLFDGDYEISISVKDLSDWDMLLIMGNENRNAYKSSATATLEFVEKARTRLDAELQKYDTLAEFENNVGKFANIKLFDSERQYQNVKINGVGRGTIHLVLNNGDKDGDWKEWEIRNAFDVLKDPTITMDTVKKIGDSSSLSNFRKATKDMTKEVKESLATDIQELNMGKRTIPVYVKAMKAIDDKQGVTPSRKASIKQSIKSKYEKGESVTDEDVRWMFKISDNVDSIPKQDNTDHAKIMEFTDFLNNIKGDFDLLYNKISLLNRMRDELTNYTYDSYIQKVAFMLSTEQLNNRLTKLIDNVKQDFESKNSNKNLLN